LGGTVLLAGRSATLDVRAMDEVVRTLQPNLVQATPTVWRALVDAGWRGVAHATLLSGGEALDDALARELLQRGGAVWNVYGPTEATVWATGHRVLPGERTVPLGAALDGVRLRVVDRWRSEVPFGVPGELWIGGSNVARGYREGAVTDGSAFELDAAGHRWYRTGDLAALSPDGSLHFMGRADQQVKLRGVRIELGEIEAVLRSHPMVDDAVAVVRRVGDSDAPIGYVTLAGGRDVGSAELRAHCARELPRVAVPAQIVVVDRFPLTASRKVDRSALPEPVDVRPGAKRPPSSATEARICEAWSRVLGVTNVGPEDDFFELGGHSLSALRVVAELERTSGRTFPLTLLFQAPTPALLARALRDEGWESEHTSLVPVRPAGTARPLFHVSPFLVTALSFATLGRHLRTDRPFYVLQPHGFAHDGSVEDRVEDIASHYLREVRDVQPAGPYLIGGHCTGATVAVEMVHQLEAAGEQVELLVVVDADPPGVQPPRRNLVRHVASRVRHYARTGRLLDALRWQLGLAVQRVLLVRAGSSTRRRMAVVRRAHAAAHARYEGAEVGCDALLVRSQEWASLPDKRVHDAWSDVITGAIEVAVVAGTHAGLVENRNAEDVAAAIEAAIARRSLDSE
jgi:thioesterase domain-containing protein